jgi:hypothetical protein
MPAHLLRRRPPGLNEGTHCGDFHYPIIFARFYRPLTPRRILTLLTIISLIWPFTEVKY